MSKSNVDSLKVTEHTTQNMSGSTETLNDDFIFKCNAQVIVPGVISIKING